MSRSESECKSLQIISSAKKFVDHITIHGGTFFPSPLFTLHGVKIRILLLSNKRGTSGIEALRASRYNIPELTTDAYFEHQNKKWKAILKKNIVIKLFSTVPWFRGTIVDKREAIFLVSPSLNAGTDTLYFYTSDKSIVNSLQAIFNDIWSDPRSASFV
jgi:hypothetical protein